MTALHRLLDLMDDAPPAQIKKALAAALFAAHPDHGGTSEAFRELWDARLAWVEAGEPSGGGRPKAKARPKADRRPVDRRRAATIFEEARRTPCAKCGRADGLFAWTRMDRMICPSCWRRWTSMLCARCGTPMGFDEWARPGDGPKYCSEACWRRNRSQCTHRYGDGPLDRCSRPRADGHDHCGEHAIEFLSRRMRGAKKVDMTLYWTPERLRAAFADGRRPGANERPEWVKPDECWWCMAAPGESHSANCPEASAA